jgi:hypothetical protein
MDWLDLELSSSGAFRLEQQRRELRSCSDPVVLAAMAEALLESLHHQANVIAQLLRQRVRLEVELMQAGGMPEPGDWHLQAARELQPNVPAQ